MAAPALRGLIHPEGVTTIAKSTFSTKTLQKLIEKTLDENKAEDIVSIDLAGKSSFADSMIVASGLNQRHIGALADHVTHKLKEIGFQPLGVEGMETGDWVLIDAGDIIVHIFRPEVRQLYNLEKMWSVAMPAQEAVM